MQSHNTQTYYKNLGEMAKKWQWIIYQHFNYTQINLKPLNMVQTCPSAATYLFFLNAHFQQYFANFEGGQFTQPLFLGK